MFFPCLTIPGSAVVVMWCFMLGNFLFFSLSAKNITVYYMASNSPVQIKCSDWLVLSWDFTVRTITMETVLFGFFFQACAPAPAKFKLRKCKKIKKERFEAGTKPE